MADNTPIVKEVRWELQKMAGKTTDFTKKIVPGSQNVLGIRLPDLRKLAKQIVRGNPRVYLESNPQEYYEERLLQCFVLGGMMLFLAGFLGELICRNSSTRNQYLIEKEL